MKRTIRENGITRMATEADNREIDAILNRTNLEDRRGPVAGVGRQEQIVIIEKREKEERKKEEPIPPAPKKPEPQKVNLRKVLAESLSNKFTGQGRQVIASEDKIVVRTKGNIIPTEERAVIVQEGYTSIPSTMLPILEPLRNNLVLTKAGATLITGLSGKASLPTYSGSSVSWAGETEQSSDSAGTFGSTPMTSKRLTARLEVSNNLLLSSSEDLDAFFEKEIASAVAEKIETTILGAHVHSDNIPDGLFTTLPVAGGAATFEKIVTIEEAAALNNALSDSAAYIVHPSLAKKLKLTPKSETQGNGYILNGKDLNGYSCYSTKSMASALQTDSDEYGIAFGDWSNMIIGMFGPMDFLLDPYTKCVEGLTIININFFLDIKAKRPNSFEVSTLK